MASLPQGETDIIEVQSLANTDATISTCNAAQPDEATAIKQSRKRTKSGCLTCRKRRIKCTEERPKCHNCVKSKRQCEGYTRRVVFKPPVNIYRIGTTDNTQHVPHEVNRQHQLLPAGLPGRNSIGLATGSKSQPQLPHIAPRPPPALDKDVQDGRARRPSQIAPSTLPNDLVISYRSFRNQHEPSKGLQSSKNPGFGSDFRDGCASRNFHRDDTGQGNNMMITQYTEPLMGSHLLRSDQSQVSLPLTQNCSSEYGFTARQTQPLPTPTTPDGILPRGPYRQSLGLVSASQVAPDVPGLFSKNTLHHEGDTHLSSIDVPTPSVEHQISPNISPDDDEDPYDINTDDEMNAVCTQEANRIPMKAPSIGVNQVEGPVRREIDPKISFETASPSGAQSLKTLPPRMKSKTRQIFYHFIATTGPSISIFERSHPDNPMMVPAVPGDPLQPSLWTYTLTTMALQNPALMHAILALSSLHIAKLQGDSMVVPIQYYHRGLLSVGKAVADVKQRGMVVTLAATMLLGFWEVMAAEHNKWNSHLLGARQLLVEADFVALSSRIRECQFAAAKATPQRECDNLDPGYVDIQCQDQSLTSNVQELLMTEKLADILTGQKGRYQRVRSAVDVNAAGLPGTTRHAQTPEAIKDDELRLDLVWWFLKQDLYQSILSQNPLLLSYDHWRDCRPRSVIGKPYLPYGTYDCLILVLGRIAHFVSRDVKRKRKAVEANGGQWRSPPGMSLGGPPGVSPQGPTGAQGRVDQGPPKPSTSPMFYGMVPPREQGHMPAEFLNSAHTSPDSAGISNSDEDFSLEVATVEAEDEWRDLKRALQVFEDSLGPGFAPISPEGIQPLSTPFGPAVHHRSGAIANIWASYYMGQIILERGHPDMPPAAIIAAGLSARKTIFPAMEIARITAGLLPENMNQPLDPTLRGALIESSLPLFFAGVQYADPAQRGWTVRRLQDIARLSGWETSLAIASGCESAWEKAGEAGHTAPYSRTLNPWAKDDRIAGRKPGYGRTEEGHINDWRSVGIDPRARVHWAVGLLGFEEDFDKLDIEQHGLEMPGQEY